MKNSLEIPNIYEEIDAINTELRNSYASQQTYLGERIQSRRALLAQSPPSAQPYLKACISELRMLYANCAYQLGDRGPAIAEAEEALALATESGYHHSMYRCYLQLGYWEISRGDKGKAVDYLLNAFTYAYQLDGPWPANHVQVLSALGKIWGSERSTLPLALMTTHWRRLIDRPCFSAWLEEFVWLLRFDETGPVLTVLEQATTDTHNQRAKYCAALIASKRFDDAQQVLEEGLAHATATKDSLWEWEFSWVLDTLTRSRFRVALRVLNEKN